MKRLIYADKKGSPDTIMEEASGITEAQAKLHKKPVEKEQEVIINVDEKGKKETEVEDASKQNLTQDN
jgi:hypothetical protein